MSDSEASPHGRRLSKVRSKDTRAELIVRRMLHAAGYRYRLHRRDLPGKPDIVFPSRKKAVFVHGCFWHQHPACAYAQRPNSNAEYWSAKFARNTARDNENVAALTSLGWAVLVVWECQIRNVQRRVELLADLKNFLAT